MESTVDFTLSPKIEIQDLESASVDSNVVSLSDWNIFVSGDHTKKRHQRGEVWLHLGNSRKHPESRGG